LTSIPEWFGRRRGGVLLHPTSLPGPAGIGELGASCRDWVRWLTQSGCSLWQVLPLGPTGYGDSPYQCFSAFAGNPLLIALDYLVEKGLLLREEIAVSPAFPDDHVEFGEVIAHKNRLLDLAARHFAHRASADLKGSFEAFRAEQAFWLEDYALFMALKEAHDNRSWTEWGSEFVARQAGALDEARKRLKARIESVRVQQFLFFEQWNALHRHAHDAGIVIVGDVPIFVAHDSADVWANARLFHLDAAGRPTVVAGVPPDYFSETGQRWGNPLYRWDAMQGDGYAWWIARLKSTLSLVDVVRLDHFRGFEAYWEIPAEAPTAETGRWVLGPGEEFLDAVQREFGALSLIAEDLGVITPEVTALRNAFNLPGMKVLQFAFDTGPDNPFLPHNYTRMAVAYTGTHDNDTTRGWYETASEGARDYCRQYLMTDGREIAWALIRAIWSSVANWAVTPLQDVLSLDASARMNHPGRSDGNWSWRVRPEQLTADAAGRLRDLSQRYGRLVSTEEGDEE
jgi:4-alpha-glucanotransferase